MEPLSGADSQNLCLRIERFSGPAEPERKFAQRGSQNFLIGIQGFKELVLVQKGDQFVGNSCYPLFNPTYASFLAIEIAKSLSLGRLHSS